MNHTEFGDNVQNNRQKKKTPLAWPDDQLKKREEFGPLSNKFSREKPQKAFDILVHSYSSVQSLFIHLRFSYWSQIGLTESFMNWTKPSYLLRF